MLRMPCGSGKSQIGEVNMAAGWVCVLVWVEKTRRLGGLCLGLVGCLCPAVCLIRALQLALTFDGRYVVGTFDLYYKSDKAVRDDHELQSWCREITETGLQGAQDRGKRNPWPPEN